MKRQPTLKHEFVTSFPDVLDDHTVYVSIPFASAVHKCCCGCGQPVVTPLSPIRWQLTFDGESISLHPSIGNSNYACRSHYWIRQNRVVWAAPMSNAMIAEARAVDAVVTARYYAHGTTDTEVGTAAPLPPHGEAFTPAEKPVEPKPKDRFWKRVKRWLFG